MLIRVNFPSLGIGYADCHPWPELGDLPLEAQLVSLINQQFTPLAAGTWSYAKREAEARRLGRPLVDQKIRLKSHFLMTDLSDVTFGFLNQLVEEGQTHLKIKLGKQRLEKEIEQLFYFFSDSFFKLRLDFNERLDEETFHLFLEQMTPLREKIEFIEDPFPWDAQKWTLIQQKEWVLACDRCVEEAIGQSQAAGVLVIKPAIYPFLHLRMQQLRESTWLERDQTQTVIVTSYLGHPIEQVAAAAIAAEIDPFGKSVHGLLSHRPYLPNFFSEKLTKRGPYFTSPAGIGCGFEREFDGLEWKY